ncbi:nucleoredoxin-like [Acanthaster planci]|uniref:Nucleoredoxin n=1 Tax=Acanthaster planci TaxID=133434 RepID=A0A8B7YYB8_ACAPL|nr:nucleoredoxin-like [Acanthaster planci]
MALVDLLGETVAKKDKTTVAVSSFTGEGKVVGLYFSAHWCPPCRAFTPKLAEWYSKFKESANGANLEIVFVSSDKDEDSFKEYFNDMPWLAVEYSNRDKKNDLSKKFRVAGIPTLILLDGATGQVNERDGRGTVMEDPTGANFPWTPKPFEEIFSGSLINNKGETKTTDDIKGKVLGLYFSAHWCGPCRGFTPNLTKSYNKMVEDGKNLEIVFCSSDRDEASFKEYFSEMPWLALPFGDKRKMALSKKFDVQGIPTLVFLDESWNLITTNGRGAVSKDPDGAEFPFYPKAVNTLSGDSASSINENTTLIWFAANKEGAAAYKDLLLPCAEEIINAAKAKGEISPMDFLVACEDDDDDDIMDGLMEFCKLEASQIPFLCIIDIPSQSIYKNCDKKEYTTDELKALVGNYLSGKLEKQKLR